MSSPFSGMPNPEIPRRNPEIPRPNPAIPRPSPETPRPFKRRSQPALIEETQKVLRAALDRVRPVLRKAQLRAQDAYRATERHARNLWQRGRRNPRMVGIVAGSAAVILLGGGYALSASSASNSLCPPNKSARFLLLMDPVPNPAVRSEMEINYDVCGLRSGTPFRGKVRLTQQVVAPKKSKKKKKAAVPKPLVVTFEDKVDGVATRRSQEVNLGATKPGVYTLELIVVDNQGRERKKVQKIAVKAKP